MVVSDVIWLALMVGYTVLAISILFPLALIYQFIWQYRRKLDLNSAPESIPRAAIILSLRGADPHLKDCLIGLLNQDYPCYSIYIIVDSAEGPAMRVITDALANKCPLNVMIQVELLKHPGEQCSLKLSAQNQVLTRLSDDFEVIVFVDADSITTKNWLRYMVAPFGNPNIGCTTGHRWFVPSDRSLGSLVRHMFNVGLCGALYAFRIPWGGSMAVRRSVLRESTLLSDWQQCFCEDASLCRVLRELNLRLAFVPAATQFNSEPSNLRAAFQFMHRQHICGRLHSRFWPIMLTAGLAFALSFWIANALVVFALATSHGGLFASTEILLLIWAFGAFMGLKVSERVVRERESAPPYAPCGWKLIPALFLLQAILSYSLIATLFARTIEWRGIRYRIEGGERIRLLKYSPYCPPEQNVSRPLSIS
jgi:cellulose synthase/poly-beta-1,6-N-acetylglucosamine synthase-like glycosyltransferase